jgi:mRNA interferase MazF
MPSPLRGEVWPIDFGLAGKTRPALVVSVAFGEQDRSHITVVPHTTSLRDSPFEALRLACRALQQRSTIRPKHS